MGIVLSCVIFCPQKKKVEWCFYKIYKINKTTRWEVVKNSASPKRPFFLSNARFTSRILLMVILSSWRPASVVKIFFFVRYNTALARFRDNPANMGPYGHEN